MGIYHLYSQQRIVNRLPVGGQEPNDCAIVLVPLWTFRVLSSSRSTALYHAAFVSLLKPRESLPPAGPEGGDDDVVDVRLQVQERMDVKERTHEFSFTFGDDGDDEQVAVAAVVDDVE